VGFAAANGDTIDSEWIVQSFCVIRSTVPDICCRGVEQGVVW
jgi:hypothetical protein